MSEDVTKACRDLNKLSVKGKIACQLFLKKCEEAGLKVLVTETYRSQARQTYLYEQGRTRPGIIVTQVKKVGYHNSGNAWDICQNIKGKEYSDNAFFAKCGEIAKSIGIEWGGYWKGFVDKPHFQISSSWEPPKQEDDEVVKKIKIQINGVVKEVNAINKDGNNFVKLQDIKDHYIDVTYDSIKKIPVVEARA